ncbi:MAG: hypothetical protein HOV94_00395, partial [Saccharothrix sp.]|nr:hypothetical protein [Saccharothrix sp.]
MTAPEPLTARQATWLLVVLHLAVISVPVLFTALGNSDGPRPPCSLLAVPLGLVLVALQLRHSLAATRDRRPAGWRWTSAVVTVLAFAPLMLPGWFYLWFSASWYPMASALVLLRGRARVVGCGVLAGVTMVMYLLIPPLDIALVAYYTVYGLISFVPPLALYGAVRLVRALGELHAAREELASLAVARERLRLSKDLHDVLGQNLAAVSLQGELALRLLRKDPVAARGGVEELTALARTTLHGIRAVAYDEYRVSLSGEVEGAVALLAAAGIDVTVDVEDTDVPEADQEVFAWAVREGTTNVLRHSDARRCSITLRGHRLVIRNDGARPSASDDGTGLAGLATRAAARNGSAHGTRLAGDVFEL